MAENVRLGRLFVSRGVMAALSADELSSIFLRHATGERRIIGSDGAEVVSEFAAPASCHQSLKVWVVTEPQQHRTTAMLSSEEPEPRDDHEFQRTHAVIAVEMLSSPTGLERVRPPCLSPPRSHEQVAAPRHAVRAVADSRTAEPTPNRARDDVYWDATANLVLDYFELLAGPECAPLVEGFVRWVKRSPDAHRRYVDGDDMDRAALVERYLGIRALPRE